MWVYVYAQNESTKTAQMPYHNGVFFSSILSPIFTIFTYVKQFGVQHPVGKSEAKSAYMYILTCAVLYRGGSHLCLQFLPLLFKIQ